MRHYIQNDTDFSTHLQRETITILTLRFYPATTVYCLKLLHYSAQKPLL